MEKGGRAMFKVPFMPREEKFFDLFEESARNAVKTAKKLQKLLETWENVGGKVAEITELEHVGDTITHQVMRQLHRTFVTPFDREDIALLAHSMDDITDFIQASADAMLIYKVGPPGDRAKELAAIIVQAAIEVEKAMLELRGRKGLDHLEPHLVEINRLENEADGIYRAAIAELFDNATNIPDIIKWREIYEHMETATDRSEDVANVLEGVALKHA
jgi:predicted phosphate transport protein (TIGR00153 family)